MGGGFTLVCALCKHSECLPEAFGLCRCVLGKGEPQHTRQNQRKEIAFKSVLVSLCPHPKPALSLTHDRIVLHGDQFGVNGDGFVLHRDWFGAWMACAEFFEIG